MGESKRAWGITKHEVVIPVNFVKLANYTMVCVKAMVVQATSYDVLVGGGGGQFFNRLDSPWIFGKRLFIIN
jgi:hypothetical protein